MEGGDGENGEASRRCLLSYFCSADDDESVAVIRDWIVGSVCVSLR